MPRKTGKYLAAVKRAKKTETPGTEPQTQDFQFVLLFVLFACV